MSCGEDSDEEIWASDKKKAHPENKRRGASDGDFNEKRPKAQTCAGVATQSSPPPTPTPGDGGQDVATGMVSISRLQILLHGFTRIALALQCPAASYVNVPMVLK